ncbi:MAG: hypothetical protein AAF570_05365 [Bacteroidota bacterium]
MTEKKPTPTLPALEDVLAYELPALTYRFRKDWDVSVEEAEELFRETKKYLWLMSAHYHDRKAGHTPPRFQFTSGTYMIDVFWHQFMLFTPQYHKFTHGFFGYFMGHMPLGEDIDNEIEAERAADPEAFQAQLEAELKAQSAYVIEKLGPETEEKWYRTFRTQYNAERLNKIRQPIVLKDY